MSSLSEINREVFEEMMRSFVNAFMDSIDRDRE